MKQLRRLFEIIRKDGIETFYYKLMGKIRRKKFYRLLKQNKWKEAAKVGEFFIATFPGNVDYPPEVAKCYQKMNRHKRANEIFQHHRNLKYDLNNIMEFSEIKNDLFGVMDSKYVLLNGNNNDGLIEHSLISSDKKLITKISGGKHKTKEELFYLNIYRDYPVIRSVTPNLISVTKKNENQLTLITLEKINGEEFDVNDKTIKKIAQISKQISSIKYGEIHQMFPLEFDVQRWQLANLLSSFALIHMKSRNMNIFNDVHYKMREFFYSSYAKGCFKRLEDVILKNKLYERINPLWHYSIQHGDLFPKNILREKETDKLYVIDWGLMRIGPSWCDMAGFLGKEKILFRDIEESYLLNEEASGHLEPIEKLFFIYTLIVVWFHEFSKKDFEKSHETHVLPAIELLEEMAMNIKDEKIKSLATSISV